MVARIYDMADEWTEGATVYTAIKMNVTDTASDAGSKLLDLQVGGSSKFTVNKDGSLTLNSGSHAATLATTGSGGGELTVGLSTNLFTMQNNFSLAQIPSCRLADNGSVRWRTNGSSWNWSTGTDDVVLVRDGAGQLALRDGVNPQALHIYNTYTDASNYERGFLGWDSNKFYVGPESAGTGSTARSVILRRNGVDQVEASAWYTILRDASSGVAIQIDDQKILARNNIVPEGVRTLGEPARKWGNVYATGLNLTDLPTADPVNAGQIWSDSGTLKISAG